MKVFCPTHKRRFTTEAATPIICEREGGHVLGGAPDDPASKDLWTYCCNCANFYPLNPDAAATGQCSVCDREITTRFLCEYCDTLSFDSSDSIKRKEFQLLADSTPQPSCPACLKRARKSLREHACELFVATYKTTRNSCPFCHESIASEMLFPATVAAYLGSIDSNKIFVKHNPAQWLLVEAETGDFVVIPHGNGADQSLVLPRATRLVSKQQFTDLYNDYYDCDNPLPGEIEITFPAVVQETTGGWKLKSVGLLKIKEEPDSLSRDKTSDPPPAPIVCGKCGTAAKSGHQFCKKCGAPLVTTAAPPLAPSPTGELSTEDPAQQPSHVPANSYSTVPLPLDQTGGMPEAEPSLTTTTGARTMSGKTIGIIIAAVVAGTILIGGVFSSSSSGGLFKPSTESKLEDAVKRGNLLAPSGTSAYDYYNELKQEGATAGTLARFGEKLLPQLTERPQQMLSNFTVVTNADPSPSEWDEAGKLLTWASELKPSDKPLAAKAAYCTGRAAYLQERKDEALNLWSRANDLDPSWVLPPNGLGLLYNERKQYATARKYLLEAIRRKPEWAVPYNNVGTSYFYERNYTQAASYYKQSAERAPEWARPHAWLGDIAYEQGDFCEAQQQYQTALNLATPGMGSWNPEKIQDKLKRASDKCAQNSYESERRIKFGVGATTAVVNGSAVGIHHYLINVQANQTMTVALSSQENNATFQVLNTQMELLIEAATDRWAGTVARQGDYHILVKPTAGTANYTLQVTIPPLASNY
jgi:tetratricopeptide (TPR) repeat protein